MRGAQASRQSSRLTAVHVDVTGVLQAAFRDGGGRLSQDLGVHAAVVEIYETGDREGGNVSLTIWVNRVGKEMRAKFSLHVLKPIGGVRATSQAQAEAIRLAARMVFMMTAGGQCSSAGRALQP